MVRKALIFGLAWVAFASTGCALLGELADPMGTQKALEKAQRHYTELVRWGELERASEFVDPALQAEYLTQAEAFHGVRFTDFESGKMQMGEDRQTATALVVYHAYSTATLVEKSIREHQQWYRDKEGFNEWRVRPQLRQVIGGVTGR